MQRYSKWHSISVTLQKKLFYAPKVHYDSIAKNGALDESAWDLSNTATKLVQDDAHNNDGMVSYKSPYFHLQWEE